ncbi:MAG TPA: right-handed parallel beta-helix repeat-containing protein, partial [Bacillota bacterium]|nr:right-handed parallel beta-helix repeat-containing protein [Bacillota bacterium]
MFEVGPGKGRAELGEVPWESLGAGDRVLIYWRTNAYQAKWVVCRQGTAEAPISIRGVPGPGGALPVIDGNGATTRSVLNYWNQPRGVIKLGGANVPPDTAPSYITIENLEVRSARPPNAFVAANGTTTAYPNNAASIYVEKGQHITIRNCRLHDSGNGLFVAAQTREVLMEGNYLFD